MPDLLDESDYWTGVAELLITPFLDRMAEAHGAATPGLVKGGLQEEFRKLQVPKESFAVASEAWDAVCRRLLPEKLPKMFDPFEPVVTQREMFPETD